MNTQAKPRIKEANRRQLLLRPINVEKLVSEDHPVRAIWEFVGRMDLSRFYASVASLEGQAGRSAWDPRLLICIWIYAYSQGIPSAREIERRFEYDPAFQWLTGMEVINHHTLSDFRMSGKATLDELFTQVLGLLSADGLITLERVMHDGTKIRANASGDTFRREERIRQYLEVAERQVQEMGNPDSDEVTLRQQKAQERARRERKEKLEAALAELEEIRKSKVGKEAKAEARSSVTDPDARIMKNGEGGFGPSFNAQISTDSAHGIVVSSFVTQSASDFNELIPALDAIEKNLKKLPDQVVVDAGFTSRENIMDVADKKVDLIGSVLDGSPRASALLKSRGVSEDFYPDKFGHDPQSDSFRCPAGKTLAYACKENHSGKVTYYYQASIDDCTACPFRTHCCPGTKHGRIVSRSIEDPVVESFKRKMQTEEAKGIYKQRGPVAEFTNAWLKTKIGLRRFSVRGFKKVELELKWACIALNIQHWTRLAWA